MFSPSYSTPPLPSPIYSPPLLLLFFNLFLLTRPYPIIFSLHLLLILNLCTFIILLLHPTFHFSLSPFLVSVFFFFFSSFFLLFLFLAPLCYSFCSLCYLPVFSKFSFTLHFPNSYYSSSSATSFILFFRTIQTSSICCRYAVLRCFLLFFISCPGFKMLNVESGPNAVVRSVE